ncbi:MAG: secondary thiamine-phosphate synthase enzyme YjbQ [Lachnospiraceae bacterium]
MRTFTHEIDTNEPQTMQKITRFLREDIRLSQIKSGIVVVFCPHTTAGITINENADPDVVRDLLYGYEKVFPTNDRQYRHYEGNSHAHMKATAAGLSQTLLLEDGKLLLGVWQDVYFCEFDGPRHRQFFVKIMEDAVH